MTENTPHNDPLDDDLTEAMIPPFTQLGDDDAIPHIVEALRHIYDPEIPVNIYELGLIYAILKRDDGSYYIKMTLTAPNCPVAEEMPQWVEDAAKSVHGVDTVEVDLSWDPPWNPTLMAETAKLQLNMFY